MLVVPALLRCLCDLAAFFGVAAVMLGAFWVSIEDFLGVLGTAAVVLVKGGVLASHPARGLAK